MRKFKQGDKVLCIESDLIYGLTEGIVYTVKGYQTEDLVMLLEFPGVTAWFDKRFSLSSRNESFKIVLWDDWIEAIEKRIKEELAEDEMVATVELDDFLYGPSLDREDPQKFCSYHSMNDIYENYVFVTHYKEKNVYWYINGEGTSMIYKPQLG
jgi:hypothetical protein